MGGIKKRDFWGKGERERGKERYPKGRKTERGSRGQQEEPQAVTKVFWGRIVSFEVPLISGATNQKPN